MSLSIYMVTIDCTDPQALAGFWTAALGTTVTGDYGEVVFLAGTPGLGLQKVAEARPGKNRVHLDLLTDDRSAEVARFTGLGASVLAEHSVPGLWWTALADPEGNESVSAAITGNRMRRPARCWPSCPGIRLLARRVAAMLHPTAEGPAIAGH